jgi:hypothetical protein
MDPFDEASEAILNWLKSLGADISSKVELKDLRNIESGRGVGKQYLGLVFGASSLLDFYSSLHVLGPTRT